MGSGTSEMIDVEDSKVQARWASRGTLQALVIEKDNGGMISSGDVVYLRSQADKHIEVEGEAVQSRWKDHGAWQAMVIEKRSGSGAINSLDLVCLRSHTG